MKVDITILSQKPRDIVGDGTVSHLQKRASKPEKYLWLAKTLHSYAQETAIYSSYQPLNMTKPDFTL
jgi:hypothetical protein